MLHRYRFARAGLSLGHSVLASSLPLPFLIFVSMGGALYPPFTKKISDPGCMAHSPLSNHVELTYSCVDCASTPTVESCVYNIGIISQG